MISIKILEQARKLALKSGMAKKYAAILLKNGKIISYGYNKYYPHKNIEELCELQKNNRYISVHAEVMAVKNCKNKKLLKDSILVLVKLKRHDKDKLPEPCKLCHPILIQKKIKGYYCFLL